LAMRMVNCYASGIAVNSARTSDGGFVGGIGGMLTLVNCYQDGLVDTTAATRPAVAGLTVLTTAEEMATSASYNGYDLDNAWTIVNRPRLRGLVVDAEAGLTVYDSAMLCCVTR